jgi:hypothetical protein
LKICHYLASFSWLSILTFSLCLFHLLSFLKILLHLHLNYLNIWIFSLLCAMRVRFFLNYLKLFYNFSINKINNYKVIYTLSFFVLDSSPNISDLPLLLCLSLSNYKNNIILHFLILRVLFMNRFKFRTSCNFFSLLNYL